jgi:hypothetical protein
MTRPRSPRRFALVVPVVAAAFVALATGSNATSLRGGSSTSSQGTGANAPYIDVTEKVDVSIDSGGAISGTPTQKLVMSAAGEGKTTVKVPMSSNSLKKHHGDPTPTFDKGVATSLST